MNKNKFEKPIEMMVARLIKNNKNRGGGFPIVGCFLDENWEILEVEVNTRALDKKTNYKNHAEFKCYSNLLNKKELGKHAKIIAIITIPPCYNCFKNIFKDKTVEWEIYYFFDDVRRKMNENYLNQKKTKINEKTLAAFTLKLPKFCAHYIIMIYLGACLTQNTDESDIDLIEETAKKRIQILKNVIEVIRPSKGQITISKVWNMICKTKQINIETVKHKQKLGENEKFVWVT